MARTNHLTSPRARRASTEPRRIECFLSLEEDENGETRGISCYVCEELDGYLTAEVSQLADGNWKARLFIRPGSYTEAIRANERDAEDLALAHCNQIPAETFFAESRAIAP